MLTAGSRPPELTEYVVHTVSVTCRINWMLVQNISYGMSFKALTDYYFFLTVRFIFNFTFDIFIHAKSTPRSQLQTGMIYMYSVCL